LTYNATSLFEQFTFSIESQNTYIKGCFCQLVKICQSCGYDLWIAIGSLQDDANGTKEAFSKRINRINNVVYFLQVGEDYLKMGSKEWAIQHGQWQLRIGEEIVNIREDSYCCTY
jgi:Txe/YoeB family toxin of Txe-Axe toxin-antitoxin module